MEIPQACPGVWMCQASHISGAGYGSVIQGTRLMTSWGKDSEPRRDQDLEAGISRQKAVFYGLGESLNRWAALAGSSLTTSSVKAGSYLGLHCTARCSLLGSMVCSACLSQRPQAFFLSCLTQQPLFPGSCLGSISKFRFSWKQMLGQGHGWRKCIWEGISESE